LTQEGLAISGHPVAFAQESDDAGFRVEPGMTTLIVNVINNESTPATIMHEYEY
jgi:hypothetical protein